MQRRQFLAATAASSDNGLSALRTAYRIAPQEIRSRPAVHRIVADLAGLSRGHTRSQVLDFAAGAGVRR